MQLTDLHYCIPYCCVEAPICLSDCECRLKVTSGQEPTDAVLGVAMTTYNNVLQGMTWESREWQDITVLQQGNDMLHDGCCAQRVPRWFKNMLNDSIFEQQVILQVTAMLQEKGDRAKCGEWRVIRSKCHTRKVTQQLTNMLKQNMKLLCTACVPQQSDCCGC